MAQHYSGKARLLSTLTASSGLKLFAVLRRIGSSHDAAQCLDTWVLRLIHFKYIGRGGKHRTFSWHAGTNQARHRRHNVLARHRRVGSTCRNLLIINHLNAMPTKLVLRTTPLERSDQQPHTFSKTCKVSSQHSRSVVRKRYRR